MITNWKLLLCRVYILIQIAFIVSAQFSANRYFTWAPHDIQTEYNLKVFVKNRKLNDIELNNRYGLKRHGWIDLPSNHLIKNITEYERFNSYSETDSIYLTYSVNGKKWTHWKLNN